MTNNTVDNESDSSMEFQDAEENVNVHLKQNLREMREDMSDYQSYYVDPKSDKLDKALNGIEKIFTKVRKTSDAVSGNQVLLTLTLLEKERIKNVHCEFRSFKNADFMDKIKANFKLKKDADSENEDAVDDEEARDSFDDYIMTKENLAYFGKMVMPYFKVLPRPTFLVGSLDKETPVVQRRARKARETNRDDEDKRTKIKEINKDSNETDTNKTVGEVERIYTFLKKYYKRSKGVPICLFQFVINPHSFSRTIENIFYLSFLVKDGYAKIQLNSDSLPVIVPNLENEKLAVDKKVASQQNDSNNVQSVISLTKAEWLELIKVYEIERPLIPDEKSAE